MHVPTPVGAAVTSAQGWDEEQLKAAGPKRDQIAEHQTKYEDSCTGWDPKEARLPKNSTIFLQKHRIES